MAQSKFTLFAGSSHPELAKEVAALTKGGLGKIKRSTFSCGEKYVVLEQTIRGQEVFLLQTCRDQLVNEDFMELFLMINAAKLSFAKKVRVIIPHFGYARQDKVHIPREPISAKVMADLLVTAGADHVIAFELHADQAQAFFDVPVDNISVHKLFASYFKSKKLKNAVVVSPDAGGAKNAKKLADDLGVPIAILHKSRPEHNKARTTHVVGDVKGKTCIIYDDMIDTAGSVAAAHEALTKSGAGKDMYLAATHAIFSGKASKRLAQAGFKEVVVTDTIPILKEKKFKGLKQISIAPLIAHIISNISHQKSVSSLFY
ncbi:ribose-phosphate diphosphokinase [Patescibacteria group bacterium]|nr:ribose-phosphate diphosphokinase [Patescibacteria group bacterium]MBU1682388.1 ribose-phosphate diphosphokinase [Patescibacteria group bacterium]